MKTLPHASPQAVLLGLTLAAAAGLGEWKAAAEVETFKVTETWSATLDYSGWGDGYTGVKTFTGQQSGTITVTDGNYRLVDRSGVRWASNVSNMDSRSLNRTDTQVSISGNYPFGPGYSDNAYGILFLGCFIVKVPLVDGEVPAFYRFERYSASGASLSSLDGYGSMTSSSLTVTVTSKIVLTPASGGSTSVAIAPAISAQPTDQAVTAGGQARFTVAAKGTPSPTYQWQQLRAATTTWEDLVDGGRYSGCKSASLTLKNIDATLNGNQYRCLVQNSKGTATSRNATLSVQTPVDRTPPKVTLASPKSGARLTTAGVDLKGTASDAGGLAGVWYQVDDGTPTLASSANAWADWSASLQLDPGKHTLRIYAQDKSGNRSAVVTVSVTYVATAIFNLTTTGSGTVTPNLNGQRLELGKNYSLSARPAKGFALRQWLDQAGNIFGTNAALTFQMRSNLAIRALFADIQKPTLTIVSPAKNSKTTDAIVESRGTAQDNGRVNKVLWSLNGGPWAAAAGTSPWTAQIPPSPGINRLSVVAVDDAGNTSPASIVEFISIRDLLPTYWPMNDGDVRRFKGPMGVATMTLASRSGGSFGMTVEFEDESVTAFYEYGNDRKSLLATGGKLGWNRISFSPAIVEMDDLLLLNGGKRQVSTTVSFPGGSGAVSGTISVKHLGTVTVPAGTYTDCKQVDITLSVKVAGQGKQTMSVEGYVLAPKIGIVRIAAYQGSDNGFRFMGWEDLTGGTIGGITLGSASGRRAALAGAAERSNDAEPLTLPAPVESIEESPATDATLTYQIQPDGQPALILQGAPGSECRVESMTDDGTPNAWTPFWVGTLPDGEVILPLEPSPHGRTFRVVPW